MAIIPMEEYLNMMTTVGASGAVYAILLAFGMLFPNQQMFIFPLPVPIKAKYFVIGYALIELYAGFAKQCRRQCGSLRTSGWYGIRLYPDYVLEKKNREMATIITDLKETFRGEHLYPTDLHQCSGIHTYYANRSHVPVVQPEHSRRILNGWNCRHQSYASSCNHGHY